MFLIKQDEDGILGYSQNKHKSRGLGEYTRTECFIEIQIIGIINRKNVKIYNNWKLEKDLQEYMKNIITKKL